MAVAAQPFPEAGGSELERKGEDVKGKEGEEGGGAAVCQDRLEALRAGYAPALSAVDQGLRLDVLALRAGEHPETHERALRIDFALWGAPRRIDRESGPSERPTLHVSVSDRLPPARLPVRRREPARRTARCPGRVNLTWC